MLPRLNDSSRMFAAVQDPAGTVLCGMFPADTKLNTTRVECRILSLPHTAKYGTDTPGGGPGPGQPRHFVSTDGTMVPELSITSGTYDSGTTRPGNSQILSEGEAVVFGGNTCVGHHGGLTCWAVDSGHGFDVADNYFRGF